MKARIDFETYSDLDLTIVGSYKYATHPSTRILMMAYKEYKHDTKLWEPGDEIPEEMERADRYYAHNAVFEYLIWTHCGDKAGLPNCPDLSQFIDVMALCGKYSYPLSLEKAAEALECKVKKNPDGKKLIKMFCTLAGGHTKENNPFDYARVKQYCIDDVEAMEEVIIALPHHELSPFDQKMWEVTQRINIRGVPVDATEAKAVYDYVTTYMEAHAERLPELTDNAVTKPTQVKRIKDWCAGQGYPMSDGLGALLIEEALEGPNPPPPHVAEVLELRKELGSSSANKFKVAQDLECDGRIHMSFIKNGAISTNRYASWNFQMHNLAKLAPLEDADALFKKFKDIEEIENPFRAAKSLVRALIQAPDGYRLCVADWSGIETCLLFWFIGDEPTLDILRNHGDLYRVMAGEVYGVSPDEVDKDTQRPLGKALILGCGYGMGFRRFKEAAKSFGVFVELPEANIAVDKYRRKFPLVQKSWYSMIKMARYAIKNPNQEVPCLKITWRFDGYNLWMKLPSGREINYPGACIKEGDIQFMGVNGTTKQWCYLRLTPSIAIENAIQGIAVDVLEGSLEHIEDQLGHEVIGHVHDEIITLVSDSQILPLAALIHHMCKVPDWAPGLPLSAEGYVERRFKK